MDFKNLFISGMAALSIALPFSANATLTIINNTSQDSTSIINNGACSSSLPGGITRAHSINVVPDIIINSACFFTPHNCKADIYMTNNCSGLKISTATFDTTIGITSVTPAIGGYQIVRNGPFSITMNGGPR